MRVPLLDRLDGQVALVTGGNRGMGAVIAAALAELGARVYVGVRDPAGFRAPAAQEALRLDVREETSIRDGIASIRNDAGRLDVLVNNAGIAPGLGETLVDEPTAQIDDVLGTNLRGAMLVTKHALPLLLARRGARVVNMSSGMGALTEGMDGDAPAYRVSKAGLNALTVYLHGEFHDAEGLLANSVCPGWVRTDMGGPQADRTPEEGAETPIWLCRFAPDAPSGHFWRDRERISW